MSRNGLTTLSDIAGKLDMLVIDCPECGRYGRLSVRRLVAERGLDATISDIMDEATADCPRRKSPGTDWYSLCRARCPGLTRML
jgi:hypothetical protein